MSPKSLCRPNSSTSQRRGRANSSRDAPQRMRLATGNSSRLRATSSARTSTVLAPGTTRATPRRGPLGVSMTCSSSAATPWRAAKPCAARLQLPSASRAWASGGPSASRAVSGACSTSSRTSTASRRGEAYQRRSPKLSPRSSSLPSSTAPRPSPRARRELDGSSSQPTSSSSVRRFMRRPPHGPPAPHRAKPAPPGENPAPRAPRSTPGRSRGRCGAPAE